MAFHSLGALTQPGTLLFSKQGFQAPMNQSLFLSHPFSFYPKDTWHSSHASRDCLKQLPYYCLSIVSQVFQSFSHSSIFPIILPINPYFCLRYPDPVNWHTSSSQPQRGKSIVWILSCRQSSELLGASNSLFFTFGLCEDQSLQLMYHCPLCSQERPVPISQQQDQPSLSVPLLCWASLQGFW